MIFPVKNYKLHRCVAFWMISVVALSSYSAGQTDIQWEKDLEKAKARSSLEKKPLLIHFYGDSCAPCQLMERDVFPNSDVIEKVNANFVAVKINVSQSPQLLNLYGVRGYPMDIYISPAGERLHERIGLVSAVQFLRELTSIAAKFPKPQTAPQSQYTQIPHTSNIALAEYNESNISSPTNLCQSTDFSGSSTAQAPSFRQPPQSISDDSEGYAISGSSNVKQESTNVAAQLLHLKTTLDAGAFPEPQATQTDSPQQFAQQQFLQPQVAEEQQIVATQPIQQATPLQVISQQTIEPQPAQPLAYQPSFNATALSAAPQPPFGYFENGMVRKQPTVGLGAGNSLGVIAAVSNAPVAIQMPTIALDGYCPVSLAQTAKWVKGNAEITTEYEGVLFRFASVEARNTFANNPDLYAPVLRGNDAVELLTNRREVTGQRKFGAWYHGQVFLFTCAENYEKFQNNPELYAFQTQQPANALASARTTMN